MLVVLVLLFQSFILNDLVMVLRFEPNKVKPFFVYSPSIISPFTRIKVDLYRK